MADHEILLKKYQELALKVTSKTRKYTLKQKLLDLGVDVDEVSRNGFNQLSPTTVSASVPSLPMFPDELQGIVSIVMQDGSMFIPPPAPFSSSQPQLLTQPPPSLHGTLEHKVSDNKYSQGTVVQWLVGRTLIRATPV